MLMQKVSYQNEKGQVTTSYKEVQKWKAEGIGYKVILTKVENL